MRTLVVYLTLASCLLAGPLAAQEAVAPAGPLAAPAAPVKAKPRQATGPKRKSASRATHLPLDAHEPGPDATVAQKTASPDNPLSLGMKWNGSNDTATQTRTQNYGGTATGTGAEVGLKLHF